MKKVLMIMAVGIFFIGTSFESQAKPPKISVKVKMTFDKRKKKDENGDCPTKGICSITIDIGVEPSENYDPSNHGVGTSDDGDLLVLVSKSKLLEEQPDKYSDFDSGELYSFDGLFDIIPSDVTELLGVNGGEELQVDGSYEVIEYDEYFVVNLGQL